MQEEKLVTVTLKIPYERHSLLKMIVAKKGLTLQQHISDLIEDDMRKNWGYSPKDGKLESNKLFSSNSNSQVKENED
jgi:hypothetical protein